MTLDLNTCVPGDYLAMFEDYDNDTGSRCGFTDVELWDMRARLARRNLRLTTDDRGIIVAELSS